MELPHTTFTSFCELREKTVINIPDGASLGHISDLEAEFCTGRIFAFLLPPHAPLFCFGKKEPLRIPLECVEKIGEDVILVRLPPPRREERP